MLTVTKLLSGSTNNVIPPTATLAGTMRWMREEVRDLAKERLKTLADNIAKMHDCEASVYI